MPCARSAVHRPPRLRVATPLVAVAIVAGSAAGQAPLDIDPTGGLRAKGLAPPRAAGAADATPQNATREELVRKWDLDGNGTIDPSEATIARAKIRRERRALELNPGFDPLTGRSRDQAAEAEPEQTAAERLLPPEPPPAPRRTRDDEPPLPGTRVPALAPAVPKPTVPVTKSPEVRSAGPSAAGGIERPRSAARQPTDRGEPVGSMTGGVRAGAPAARQGYGSLMPRGDLNAGRRPLAAPSVSSPGGPRMAPSGGLVPSLGRPALPGRAGTAAPAPPPPPVARPRITAEDIGGF